MIGEALMGLEFSPDPKVVRLLASDNEETNSTLPGPGETYPSPTPGSDIFFSTAVETPHYLHGAPSPLPSPLAPRVLVPPLPPPSDSEILQNSPQVPLTPFSELPTPSRWLSSPSPQKFTPSMFIQTPESLRKQISDPDKEASEIPEQIQAHHMPAQQIGASQITLPNPMDSQDNIAKDRIDRERGSAKNLRPGDRRTPMILEKAQKLPEVRRRLFDQEDDDERRDVERINATIKGHKPPPSPATTKSPRGGNTTPGLKSRLAPPPPITVPGPSNTTPGGIYPLSKNPSRETVDVCLNPRIVLPPLNAQQLPQMLKKPQNAHNQSKKVKILEAAIGEQRKKKKSRNVKPDVEEKRPMSERASLVLAEMRRQMSQAQRGGDEASNSTVAVGTDATNFLSYASAVQGSLNIAKESERTVCNCKASQCIKRYCPCFATSNFCGKGCGCRNCENTTEYSSVVGRARRVLLERDPNAFVPRIRNSKRSSGRGRQTIRGCNCRKGCEKNYCICKENGLICGIRCTCSGPNGCQNYDQSKLTDVPHVIENFPCPRGSGNSNELAKPKTTETRDVQHKRNVKHDKRGLNSAPEKVSTHENPCRNQKNVSNIPARAGLGPFDVLPTPTASSIPYNPFSAGEPACRKRSITFGNPLDAFKKIRTGDHNGSILPELRQSSSRYTGYHYKTPPPKTSAPPGTFTGTPLTSKVLSGDTPPANGADEQWIGQNNDGGMNHRAGGDIIPDSNKEGKRLPHIPRIFRYRFGSGKGTGSFSFK